MDVPERNSSGARRAEDFLELVERARRGRLKLYVGFAAGVGKTYRMLQEAHDLRRRGVDVVIAFIEPHGRAETSALIEGLEAIPRRRVDYRGVTVEEMDLEAVMLRRPTVAVVDEIPHTNVPGSRNRKRYQDVLALIDGGINVIGAMNVQHLESLNGLIERAPGVVVRETVPDNFLTQADQVVNLDLTVEDLQERLRAGKIYVPEKIPWALEHFFKDQNLATLRELALREVAESLDRAGLAKGAPEVKASGRVMRGRRDPADEAAVGAGAAGGRTRPRRRRGAHHRADAGPELGAHPAGQLPQRPRGPADEGSGRTGGQRRPLPRRRPSGQGRCAGGSEHRGVRDGAADPGEEHHRNRRGGRDAPPARGLERIRR